MAQKDTSKVDFDKARFDETFLIKLNQLEYSGDLNNRQDQCEDDGY